MKLIFIFSFFLLLSFSSFSNDKSFSTTYSQIRNIKSSSLILKSSGVLNITNGEEIVWKQIKPFEFSILMKDGVVEQTFNGVTKTIDNPIMLNVSSVLKEILNDNFAPLEKDFSLTYNSKNKGLIQLVPRNAAILKIISKINILKDSKIKEVHLMEGNGNSLLIKFQHKRAHK